MFVCRACAMAAVVAAELACSTTAPGLRGEAISVTGEYLHAATQVRFPDRLGDLERAAVLALDADEAGVGVVYAEGRDYEVTIALTPAGEPIAGRLRGEFLRARGALREGSLVSMVDRTAVVRAPRPDGRAVGFESELRLMVTPSGATDRVLLQVFQCGRFFLRVHATQADGVARAMRPDLDQVHELVSCADIAEHPPRPAKLRVGLDPELLQARTGNFPEWIAHGFAQLEWLEAHVAKEDLAFGIPDHDPALYLSAWEKTLSLRDRLARRGEAFPNPFFERLTRVQRAGYLEEYVWTEYVGFLDPSAERQSRLEKFRRWRDRRLPEHRHEVRAAAELEQASD